MIWVGCVLMRYWDWLGSFFGEVNTAVMHLWGNLLLGGFDVADFAYFLQWFSTLTAVFFGFRKWIPINVMAQHSTCAASDTIL
jgi:hypothetical protein